MDRKDFPIFQVNKKAEAAIREGHPWVYAEEITGEFGEIENGCLAHISSPRGAYLGTGLVSTQSKIRVRLLSSNPNEQSIKKADLPF